MPRRDFRPKDKPAKTAGGRGDRASGPSQRQAGGRGRPSNEGQRPPQQHQSQQHRPAHASSGPRPHTGQRPSNAFKGQARGNKVVFGANGVSRGFGGGDRASSSFKPKSAAPGAQDDAGSDEEEDDEEEDDKDSDQGSLLGDDEMLAEIEALGGDSSDLDLIKGVGKSTAGPPTAENDPKLKSDLQAFLKQLNLPSIAPEAPEHLSRSEEQPVKKEKAADAQKEKVSEAENVKPEKKAELKKEKEDKKGKKGKEEFEGNKAAGLPTLAQSKAIADGKSAVVADPPGFKSYFQPADPSQLAVSTSISKRDGLFAQVTPLWSQTSLPKLAPAPPPSEKVRRRAKAANLVGQHASLSDEHIASLEERATKLLERENAIYARMFEAEATGTANAKTSLAAAGSTISASDARFIRTLLSTSGEGGTLSDRISALTLLLQSSPLHNLRPLESLMAMVRKKNREESGRSSRALSDWFASASGLPADRKLRYFRDQPGLADVAFALSDENPSKDKVAAAEQHLLLYAFEQRLKNIFFEFLLLLEARSHDTLAFARTSAVIQVSNLLSAKPEQEQNLLRLLVNKLGDGECSVAAKASNALLELLNNHPGMKNIVVREVADLILKPAVSVASSAQPSKAGAGGAAETKKYNSHARYYGVLTLNQTMITSKDRESGLANALVNLYFELFEGILEDLDAGKRGGKGLASKEDRLGAGGQVEEAEDDEDDEGAAAKPKDKKRWRDQKGKGRKKGGKQHASSSGGKEINAVVKDAEAKIVAALLTGVRRAMPFAHLETAVFERHIDTLFRITHTGTFNISIQALQLIFQVCTAVPAGTRRAEEASFTSSAALKDRYYRALYASLIDQRLEETSKQAMYLNLLFRSMKVDVLAAARGGEEEAERLKAFSKRLVQVLGHHQPPFACGALFMLGELSKLSSALRDMLTVPAELRIILHEEEDDSSSDVGEETADSSDPKKAKTSYDGIKRDPRFAHAGSTCLWELLPLTSHYHPSVALHTRQLLDGETITANADLNTSSLSHFLDRFVFRNPKAKAPAAKGASIMQPGAGVGTGSLTAGVGVDDVNVVNLKGRGLSKEEDVMNPKFWKRSRDSVPVDQLFFHQYFQQKQAREKAAAGGGKSQVEEEADGVDALLKQDEHQDGTAGDSDADSSGAGADGADDDDDDEVLDEEEFGEEEIWEAIMNALPESGDVDDLEDSEDSDDDEADSDLDPEDFSDDEELDAILGRTGKGGAGGEDDADDDDEESEEDEDEELFLQEDDDDSLEGGADDDSGDDEDEEEVDGAAADQDDDDDESLDVELLEDEDDLLSFDGDSEFGGGDDTEQAAAPPAPPAKAASNSKRKDKRKRGADEEEEDESAAGPAPKLSNRERRQQRKERKALPTFASADDYAHLLDSDDDGNA